MFKKVSLILGILLLISMFSFVVYSRSGETSGVEIVPFNIEPKDIDCVEYDPTNNRVKLITKSELYITSTARFQNFHFINIENRDSAVQLMLALTSRRALKLYMNTETGNVQNFAFRVQKPIVTATPTKK